MKQNFLTHPVTTTPPDALFTDMLLFRDITVKSVAWGFLLKFLACHCEAEHVGKQDKVPIEQS